MKVARQLAFWQSVDKGALPYFVDGMHPPCYDEGVRVEGPLNAYDSEEEKENDMGTPEQVEERMTKKMRGKLEMDKQKLGEHMNGGNEDGSTVDG